MARKLVQVECPPECGFLVRSHDEHELIDIVLSHATNVHEVEYTASDVRKNMTTLEGP